MQRSRILIADDDTQVRKMLRQCMEKSQYQVKEASDGRQALRVLREESADLAIIDIFMPEIDGLEIIPEIRSEFPKVSIIAISGGGQQVDGDFLHLAQMLGAECVFQKPLDLTELLRAVDKLAEKRAWDTTAP